MNDNFIDEVVRQSMTEKERLEYEKYLDPEDDNIEILSNRIMSDDEAQEVRDDDRPVGEFLEDFLSGGLPDEEYD